MSRFHRSDLQPFIKAIAHGLVVRAHSGPCAYKVLSIKNQSITIESGLGAKSHPLSLVTRFEIDTHASLGF
jgi:hypothetical protein